MIIINIVLIVLIVAIIVGYGYRIYTERKVSLMSFKEALDLTDLPVVTFSCKGNKVNMLLDTGSNNSFISGEAAKSHKGNFIENNIETVGLGGSTTSNNACKLIFNYNNEDYDVTLIVSDQLTDSFKEIKKATGVQLHGILGVDFLTEHKYILDFAEKIAYHKSWKI